MELSLKLKQQLSQHQLQSVEILQMNALELEQYLQNLAEENPVIDLERTEEPARTMPENDFLRKAQWLEDNDYQNRYYQSAESDDFDPFYQVGNSGGLEETLASFLLRQLQRLDLGEDAERLVRYLIFCLDDNGYFPFATEELAAELALPLSEVESGLKILRSLEPAGVGAVSLSQCLQLQLQRIGYSGPALDIVHDHLEDLGRHHYREIAGRLCVSVEAVHEAAKVIRELEPKPGAIFSREEQTLYIQPDVFVVETDGGFAVQTKRDRSPGFTINTYYQKLYSETPDAETKEYLAGKLRQAENIMEAVRRRESTLKRCAQSIVEHQQEFFRLGPGALAALRMTDIADELELHDSTVSRAIREKYLQCSHGVFPLRYFFTNNAGASNEPQTASAVSAKVLLKKLVAEENPAHPLSDQKIADEMARQGCPISRRTVAKYRDELNIPGTFGRKAR